jgi:hypothetical protein
MRRGLLGALVLAALVSPAQAGASQILGATNGTPPSLKVNRQGIALVTYTTFAGKLSHTLAWGAINGLPHPATPPLAQQKFKIDFSGGWKSHHDSKYWKKFKNACGKYDGPPLPFLIYACKAPDGSYWAIQTWQRNLPMRGYDPWTNVQKAYELHLSHWSGAPPSLDITMAWTYAGQQQGFFGRMVYQDQPVYGTHSTSATVGDPFARNISIDTFNSSYGTGWRHATQISTHPNNGGFCYTFVPQPPPSGYPSQDPHGNGLGPQIRVEAMGPGVTPIVATVVDRLSDQFSASANSAARAHFDQILAGDQHCAPERPS